MGLIERGQALSADDTIYAYVDVPEWGGDGAQVKVRSMTGLERAHLEQMVVGQLKGRMNKREYTQAWAVVQCCVNEDGSQLFEDYDLGPIAEKNASPVSRIWTEIATMSGIVTPDDEEEEEENSF